MLVTTPIPHLETLWFSAFRGINSYLPAPHAPDGRGFTEPGLTLNLRSHCRLFLPLSLWGFTHPFVHSFIETWSQSAKVGLGLTK